MADKGLVAAFMQLPGLFVLKLREDNWTPSRAILHPGGAVVALTEVTIYGTM